LILYYKNIKTDNKILSPGEFLDVILPEIINMVESEALRAKLGASM